MVDVRVIVAPGALTLIPPLASRLVGALYPYRLVVVPARAAVSAGDDCGDVLPEGRPAGIPFGGFSV
jgi:hypothetical protein